MTGKINFNSLLLKHNLVDATVNQREIVEMIIVVMQYGCLVH